MYPYLGNNELGTFQSLENEPYPRNIVTSFLKRRILLGFTRLRSKIKVLYKNSISKVDNSSFCLPSIQVTNWKSEEIVAFRFTGFNSPIADIVMNPYNKYEFATCGYKEISIWSIQGMTMERTTCLDLPPKPDGRVPFFTCLAYMNYHVSIVFSSWLIRFAEISLVMSLNMI